MGSPAQFPGCNANFGPPPGLEEMVGHLPCFVNKNSFVAGWKLSPEEIKMVVETGMVYASIGTGTNPATGMAFVLPLFVGGDLEEVRQVTGDFGPTW